MTGPIVALFRLRLHVQRRLGHPPPRVFCIGFNKTGTTSLHVLLEGLGFRSYHGLRWHDRADREVYDAYECFSDGFPLDWPALVDEYPDARFVLNVRDCRSWLLSRLRHIRRSKEEGTYTGGDSWGAWDDTVEAVRSWIREWHDHHVHVLRTFEDRPGRLLVVNMVSDSDAGPRLASFLGCPGRVATPHANAGRRQAASGPYDEMIELARQELGIPRGQLDNDLTIPALLSNPDSLPADTGHDRHDRPL